MSTLIKVVVAQMYVVAVLSQSLHLIVYLLRDTDKKQYLHFFSFITLLNT